MTPLLPPLEKRWEPRACDGRRPTISWPVALRRVQAWLAPWTFLWRWWRAWSTDPPPAELQALIDRLPGAEALLAQHSESGGAFPMGGIMGAGTKMMSAGLSMGQVQGVTRETIAYAREKIGDDAVGEIVGAIPGLSQFV